MYIIEIFNRDSNATIHAQKAFLKQMAQVAMKHGWAILGGETGIAEVPMKRPTLIDKEVLELALDALSQEPDREEGRFLYGQEQQRADA